MDLTKLTPAPWEVSGVEGMTTKYVHSDQSPGVVAIDLCPTDAAFVALARNAFDAMMRRGWGVFPSQTEPGWGIVLPHLPQYAPRDKYRWIRAKRWPDPFTALVEADRWYSANMEKPTS